MNKKQIDQIKKNLDSFSNYLNESKLLGTVYIIILTIFIILFFFLI